MINDKDWAELAGALTAAQRSAFSEKLRVVLGKQYFRPLTDSEWAAGRGAVEEAVGQFFAAIGGDGAGWRDAWIEYLSGEGEVIMNPDAVAMAGPKQVAQTWAVIMATVEKADLAALVGPAGFNVDLPTAADMDELWTLSGTLTGLIAARAYPVLKANPYEPAYVLYAAGLRPRFMAPGGFRLDVTVGGARRTYAWTGRLVELDEGSAA